MKILLTGTAGFIGFHLANHLIKEGYSVLGLDIINDYYDIQLKYDRLAEAGFDHQQLEYGEPMISNNSPRYSFAKAKLEDKEAILRIFDAFRPDIVINLAAQAGVRYSLTNPGVYIESNINGFLNILEACRRFPVSHLIYASSSSVYGLNKKMPFSEHHPVDHPVSLYAASKKSNEMMAHAYSHLFQIPTTGLRFFTVYGPWGRPDMALFIFTRAILKEEPIEVYNFGHMERDFTYVDDIVNGISAMIDKPATSSEHWDPYNADPANSSAPYRIYNIGNNKPVKLLDFIQAIEEVTGKKAIKNMLPIQPGDVEKTWADVSGLIDDFHYEPKTSVRTGVKRFVEWFREYYNYL